MGLVDLWNKSPDQLKGKHVQQVIAFAGTGKLTDGGEASADFRKFLSLVCLTAATWVMAETGIDWYAAMYLTSHQRRL